MRTQSAVFSVSFFSVVCLAVIGQSFSQDVISNRKPSLEERLNLGLKARRPSEKAFVRQVVTLVDNGTLKQKTVDEAFFWVRREIEKSKKGHSTARKHIQKYPFVFFQKIVKLNAKRNGVIIP